ncbi:MAG: N-acetylmuramoyl-L-alanine amidase [Byssovorax sp.]
MRRLLALRALPLLLPLVPFAIGCSPAEPPITEIAGPTAQIIAEAAAAEGVPRDLMVAIAQEEGGLALSPHRTIEAEELVPVAGVLELRHGRFDSLARGAALLGLPERTLCEDRAQGTRAGARVLDDLGRAHGVRGRDALDAWAEVVEELSGYLSRYDREDYRARIFRRLRHGATVIGYGGEAITLPAHPEIPIELTFVPPAREALGAPEFAGATWFETPQDGKWAQGRAGYPITMIAVHDTEGGWDASVSTLQNDPGKSVHYIIDADGSRVGQFVHEADTAWHVGNGYYNKHMVGIEHVGYAGKDDYQTALYEKSGELVRDIAKRNHLGPNGDGTALDRSVMVGHQEVPNGNAIPASSPPCADAPESCVKDDNYGGANNHRDPGVYWEWCQYMHVIGDGAMCKCNDAHKIFNCVHDLSARVSCQDGVVHYEECPGGCEVKPIGEDDACVAVPGTGGTGGAGGAGGEGGAGGAGGQGGQVGTGGKTGETTSGSGGGVAAKSGCAIAGSIDGSSEGSSSGTEGPWALLALAALGIRRARISGGCGGRCG